MLQYYNTSSMLISKVFYTFKGQVLYFANYLNLYYTRFVPKGTWPGSLQSWEPKIAVSVYPVLGAKNTIELTDGGPSLTTIPHKNETAEPIEYVGYKWWC